MKRHLCSACGVASATARGRARSRAGEHACVSRCRGKAALGQCSVHAVCGATATQSSTTAAGDGAVEKARRTCAGVRCTGHTVHGALFPSLLCLFSFLVGLLLFSFSVPFEVRHTVAPARQWQGAAVVCGCVGCDCERVICVAVAWVRAPGAHACTGREGLPCTPPPCVSPSVPLSLSLPSRA